MNSRELLIIGGSTLAGATTLASIRGGYLKIKAGRLGEPLSWRILGPQLAVAGIAGALMGFGVGQMIYACSVPQAGLWGQEDEALLDQYRIDLAPVSPDRSGAKPPALAALYDRLSGGKVLPDWLSSTDQQIFREAMVGSPHWAQNVLEMAVEGIATAQTLHPEDLDSAASLLRQTVELCRIRGGDARLTLAARKALREAEQLTSSGDFIEGARAAARGFGTHRSAKFLELLELVLFNLGVPRP
jgi:hypothetical protein